MMELQVNGTQTIPSYEIADMMDKKHWEVLRMLEGYEPPKGSKSRKVVGIIPTLNHHNVVVVEYFILNTYVDAKGETRKCYECTRMGCDMLANKMTGEKGILFTARYVKKFNEMEKLLLEQNTPSYMISDPIKRAEQWIKEQKEKQLIEEQKKLIEEKHDNLVHTSKTYTTTEIAKELGFKSATALNKDLESKKIQYKMNGTWVLNAKFSEKDFVNIKQSELEGGRVIYNRRWTGKGRDWLVNEIYNKK